MPFRCGQVATSEDRSLVRWIEHDMAVRELYFFGLVLFSVTKFRIRMTMVSDWHLHWKRSERLLRDLEPLD
jgi:hypothetical protein